MSQAGTQDGYINIFEITSDSLTYDRLTDKQEGILIITLIFTPCVF